VLRQERASPDGSGILFFKASSLSKAGSFKKKIKRTAGIAPKKSEILNLKSLLLHRRPPYRRPPRWGEESPDTIEKHSG